MIKQIENFEFQEWKHDYKYLFGEEQGHENGSKFEINFGGKIIFGISSNDLSKPELQEWDGKNLIIINNELHVIDKQSLELIKSF